MRDLQSNARSASTSLTALTARATTAAVALRALAAAANDASRELRTLRGRAAAAAASLQDLRDRAALAGNALGSMNTRAAAAHGRLGDLSTSTRTLRADMDDLDGSLRRVGPGMTALRGRLGTLRSSSNGASGGMQKLMQVALLLSPALIPIAAATVPIVAGLGASAVALGVFGIAIGSQIKDIAEASQAMKKYETAVEQYGKSSTEAAKAQLEYQRLVKDMPPATRQAAAAMSVLKDQYKAWSTALAGDTMPVVTKSMAVFGSLLPKLTPLVRGTSTELQRMMTLLAGGIQTQGFDSFMAKFTEFATGALRQATDGMVHFSRVMAGGAGTGAFGEFMSYVRSVGPAVGETLGNLAKAMIHLVAAASDVGVGILTAVNAFAKLVNAIPTEALSTLIQFVVVLKAVKLAAAGMAASSAGMTAFATGVGAMRTAAAGASGRLTTLSAAFGTLSRNAKVALVGTGIGLLVIALAKLSSVGKEAPPDVDRLTTSLANLGRTGKVTGEAARVFGSDLGGLADSLRTLARPSNAEGIQQWATSLIGMDSTPVKNAKEDLDGADKALASLVKGGKSELAAAAFDRVAAAMRKEGMSAGELRSKLDDYKSALADQKLEQELAAQAMGVFGQQALEVKTKLDAQKMSADGLRASIMALNDTNRSAYDAQIAFEAGIDALTASFKENGNSLNTNTEAGRKNGTAMSQAAKAHDEMLASGLAAGESLGSMTGKSERLRSKMMELATATFKSKEKAKEYVNTLLGTPGSIKTAVELERKDAISGLESVRSAIQKTPGAKSVKVNTLNAAAIRALEAVGLKTRTLKDGRTEVYTKNGQALGSIGAVSRALNSLRNKTVTVTTNYVKNYLVGRSQHDITGATGGRFTGSGFRTRYATGGKVHGPGGPTSDDVFAPWLSAGEFVMKAKAVARYGEPFMQAVNDGQLKLGLGYAKGGKVSEKQKAAIAAEKARQSEGKKALTSDTTFTTAGRLAGYKYTETVHDLGMPDSVGSLVTSVNTYLSNIKKAFSGKTEATLVAKMTSSGKALLDNQKKLEGVNKSLDAAKSTLDDLKGKFDSLKTSVSSSLVGFGNITKIGKYGTSADTLIKQLQSDTSRTSDFSKQLEALKGKGLNAQAISDIAAAGVTGGGMSTAQSLLNATPEQIAKINELQKQLQKSADAAGTTAANAMYGAGLKAAEGVVAGLTAKQKAIEATMMAIAKSMEAAIKKALGIKSPSKVMESVGDYAFQGIEQGWVKRAAAGATPISGSAVRVNTGIVPPGVGTGTGGGGGITVQTLNVNVKGSFDFASPGERKAVAKALVKDINDELRTYQRERSVGR
jgi:hypothetical protein